MTAALEGGEWSAAPPGRILPPGKTRYPFYSKLGGPQGRSGRAENLFPTGIRSRTIQLYVVITLNKILSMKLKVNIHIGNTVFSVQYVGCVVERERRNVEAR